MLRHTALFMWRDTSTEQQKLVALKGLAYMSYGCPSVRRPGLRHRPARGQQLDDRAEAVEAHAALEGARDGSAVQLGHVPLPGLRRPGRAWTPTTTDPVHHEVGVYNESVCRPERTARIDWWYDGPSRIEKGLIHSVALYLWRDEATDTQKDDVREAFRSLNKSVPAVKSLITGDGTIGTLATDYDLIVDGDLQRPSTTARPTWSTPPTRRRWRSRWARPRTSGRRGSRTRWHRADHHLPAGRARLGDCGPQAPRTDVRQRWRRL